MSNADNHSNNTDELSSIERWANKSFITLLRSWRFILLIILAFSVIAGFFEVSRKYNDMPAIYRYGIFFNFENRTQNQYPDGSPFFLSDLTDNSLIAEIYQSNDIAKYGLSLSNFTDSFSVRPFNSTQFATIREFELLSKNWVNSLSDLQTIKEDMESKLAAGGGKAALITFIDSTNALPTEISKKILVELAENWARNAKENRGVLQTQLSAVSPEIFDDKLFDSSNRRSSIEVLRRRLAVLDNFVERIQQKPGGKVVTDEVSGLNVSSLREKISDTRIQMYEIPRSWSFDTANYSTDSRLPVNVFSPAIYNGDILAGRDQLLAIEITIDRLQLIRSDVNKILETAAGGFVSDPETGMTLYDLDRTLVDLRELDLEPLRAPVVSLGISNEPARVKLLYNSRIEKLQRDLRSNRDNAEVIKATLAESGIALGNSALAASTNDLDGRQQQSVTTQLGDGFVDRLLELSEKSSSNAFTQELLNRWTAIRLNEIQIESNIAELQNFVSKVERRQRQAASELTDEQAELIELTTRDVEETLPIIVQQLAQYAAILNRISSRLGYAEEIYQALYTGVDDPKYRLQHYLLDKPVSASTLTDVVSDLRDYTEVANRLLLKIGSNNPGSGDELYIPLTSVDRLPVDIIEVRSFLAVFQAAILGGILGVILVLLPWRRRQIRS